MNKKLAVLAVLCTILIIIGGINTTILYSTQYLSSKPGYSFSVTSGLDWWDCDWSYCKKITIDHTKVQATQTDYPVLIYRSSDADLVAHAQSNGDDIAFVDQYNTTQYKHEIEKYDSNTGELVAWVKITSLSSTTDTILYMYYGNPNCISQEDITSTWNSNYKMVQHLNESSGTLLDSTSNNNDGTNNGANPNASSKIDGGYDFDGTNDYINCFDERTEVLTNHGWKLFKNLNKNDLIATLNPENNQVEYQKPYNYISYHYNGKMIKVNSEDVNLLVTPNHNMYVSRYNETSNSWDDYKLVRADEIFNENVRYKIGNIPDEKSIASSQINNFNSSVETTLTRDCCLNRFSLDHIIQPRDNASAKYGTSFGWPCNNSCVSLTNLAYLRSGTTSILLNKTPIKNSISALFNPEKRVNLSNQSLVSSAIYAGEYNLNPFFDNNLIKSNVQPFFINAANNMLASTTNFHLRQSMSSGQPLLYFLCEFICLLFC